MGKGACDDFNTVIMIITQVYDCQLNNSCFFSVWWKYMLVYICGKVFPLVLSGAGKWAGLNGFENNFVQLLINTDFRYEITLNVDEIFYYFYWNLFWELYAAVIMCIFLKFHVSNALMNPPGRGRNQSPILWHCRTTPSKKPSFESDLVAVALSWMLGLTLLMLSQPPGFLLLSIKSETGLYFLGYEHSF